MEGIELDRVFAVRDLVNQCYEAGWTGSDLKEFVATEKRERFEMLDDFAGGALTQIKSLPIYPLMLELTAIRYALEKNAPLRTTPAEEEEIDGGEWERF